MNLLTWDIAIAGAALICCTLWYIALQYVIDQEEREDRILQAVEAQHTEDESEAPYWRDVA